MANQGTMIRAAKTSDAASMAEIYNHYVASSIVTFEEEPVTAADIARRIEDIRSASLPWLVAERGNRMVGYAYASRWRTRSAYRFSTEITAYVTPESVGQGIGSNLYSQIIPLLRMQHVHAVMGGIALPNDASVALHENFGFQKVAHFAQVGFKFGRWIDVGYWQLLLEAR